MTSKEQERKALEQIRKIVDGLGEGSYVGTAFEGCFEIADENIRNDFGCSMKQRKEAAEAAEDGLREQCHKKDDQIKALKADNERLAKAHDNMSAANNRLQDSVCEYTRKIADLIRAAEESHREMLEAERKLEAKDNEIVHLKAKLYDLMTK